MPDMVSSIVYGFALQLKNILQSRLSKVILYGSYYDLAYDIELEEGIHISVIIKNEEQFEYWEDTLPFYKNVKKEGIEINA